MALLLLSLLLPSRIKTGIVLCCWCSCAFWATGSRWQHSVSSSAVCTPVGPPLRRAATLVWPFSSTCLYAALALPQMANASSRNLCLLDCRQRNPSGRVLLFLLQLRHSWPLFSANGARVVFCLSQTTVMHRNAVSPLFSFGFLSRFSLLHRLWPTPSTPSCFLLPLRLIFYGLCSTGSFFSEEVETVDETEWTP